jgi:two-component system cell cycle response regulator DivK
MGLSICFEQTVARPIYGDGGLMSKTVLVVEDDDLNRTVFRDVLLAHGYTCVEAVDGKEAIQLAEEWRPDLILMDMRLSDVSGMDVTRKLKATEALRHIPVIAVSAFDGDGYEDRVRACGCQDYLSMPISIGHLMETIERHIE